MGILQIREIFSLAPITRVPSTPEWVRGVMNLRGSVIPVIDLAVKLGRPAARLGSRSCIVIVETGAVDEQVVMGLLVDCVNQVLDLLSSEIEEPPAFGTGVQLDYLEGLGKIDERLVLLLDIDRVLSSEELSVASALGREGAASEGGESAS